MQPGVGITAYVDFNLWLVLSLENGRDLDTQDILNNESF